VVAIKKIVGSANNLQTRCNAARAKRAT
jgi:hypothetical protein